jgi:mannose-1-phosphate guanylyltransferase
MSSELNVMLLAAGLGTRLSPLTLKHPKPAIPFLNVPMGFFQFQFLNFLDIATLTVNTHHLPKQIHELYKNQPYYRKPIQFSNESGKILGGAGGLKKASSHMQKNLPILLMNADEVYFTKQKDFLKLALERHQENKNLSTVVVIKHPEAGKKFGALWADHDHVIKDISKSAQHSDLTPWHAIGPIFLSAEVLSLIPENVESNIFYDILLQKLIGCKVEVFPIEADWYETGNPKDYFEATKIVLEKNQSDIFDFINIYDDSVLVKNAETLSLVSKAQKINYSSLSGVNVISKSSLQLCNLKKVESAVLFENEIVNSDYFSKKS